MQTFFDGGLVMSAEISAEDLGIDMSEGEGALFKWFLASFLFGKRIQQDIAAEAYRVIVDKHKRDTPRKLGNCSWQQLVDMLGEGHYVRYDESTAERLLKLCEKLDQEYDGKLGRIHELSESRKDLEKRLADFEGVGPKTVEIFMREAAKVWY
jgi:endonuclease III